MKGPFLYEGGTQLVQKPRFGDVGEEALKTIGRQEDPPNEENLEGRGQSQRTVLYRLG